MPGFECITLPSMKVFAVEQTGHFAFGRMDTMAEE
jgi:hypothetical protein